MDVVTTGTSFTAPLRAPKIYINQSVILSTNDFNSKDLDLIMTPNPSNGYINIEMNSKSQTDIEIYDYTGRIVLNESFFDSMWKVYLNETHGLYIVRLTIDNRVYTRKIQLK
jgi:hypothetical protein